MSSEATRRSRASKRKGATWETTLLAYLRGQLGGDVERLARRGSQDEGDIVITPYDQDWPHVVVEAKNAQRLDLAGWTGEAEVEAKRYAEARALDDVIGAVVVKRRNHGAGKAYVVLTLDSFLRLV